jgi:ferredoxin
MRKGDSMSFFTIDPEKCNQDEICVKACPTSVIRMGLPDEVPVPTPEFEEYYFELFAPTLGLGSCWGGYFYSAVNAYPPLFEALGLPADHRAYGAVMVGYAKLKYQRLPLRNEPRVSWK